MTTTKLLCVGVFILAATVRAADDAKQIAALTGFHGGLVVHVGCGDGKLTAALRLADNCVVQGLDADVTAARQHIQSLGLYGPVSIMRWSGGRLPYVDNLVTLVVCEDSKAASRDEIMRVLRPLGAMAIKQGGKWTATVKPWPKDIDEWQQHYHGADNNSVARDSVVGPPRRYQWLGEPEWQRSHLAMPSINSLVSSKGRLFTVEDLGSAEHPALPGKFALTARDAYNGIVLWRVVFGDWHPIYIRDKETPVQLQRRLVAVGDVVYCTPGYSAPVTAFDAATGAIQKKYEGTAKTQEFVHDHGVLFIVTGDQFDVSEAANTALGGSLFKRSAYGPIIPKAENPKNDILALDAASGRELWRKSGDDTKGYEGASLGISGDRVVFATEKELVCLDRATGKALWRVAAPIVLKGPHGIAVSLVLSERAAFLADSQKLRAFRLADGKALWSQPVTINHHKPPDVLLANGFVWAAAYDASSGRPAPALGLTNMGVNAFDPDTGKLIKRLPQEMTGPMGHDRCYRNRITTKYYVNTATGGSDFLGLESPSEFPNPWIRGTCGIGILPCNGLFYAGPPSCSCCNGVMLNGLNALSTEPGFTTLRNPIIVDTKASLEKGPAYSAVSASTSSADDWPTYRHDGERTGMTKAKTVATLAKRWETKLGAHVSSPVIAGGMVFVADVDGHAVCGMNATDGKLAWRFTAEGRVDSPPTFHQGLLLFGSRDGTVYCLRASDGALAWRFRPLERRLICAYGQPESAWPVCGSILIKNGLAYFAAGRNSFIDGGIYLFALDPSTGKVIHQRHMFGPYNEKGFPEENNEAVGNKSIDGFKSDVFLTAGDQLFLRQQAFNADLTPIKLKDVKQPHLITSHGFLEAIPQHRSFWTIDTALRYDIQTGFGGVHGDILVMDGNRFYEVRGYQPGRTEWFDPRTAGYTLYAGTYGGQGSVKEEAKGKRAKAKKAKFSSVARSTKLWSSSIPLTGKALALAGDTIFVAGTPVAFPEDDLAKAYEGRMGGVLWAASVSNGEKLAQYTLDAAPAWDGLAAANGVLFVSLADGRVVCMGPR